MNPDRVGPLSLETLLSRARERVRVLTLEETLAARDSPLPPVLVDVRDTEEYEAGHIEGARHVPRGLLEMRAPVVLGSVDASAILYCASGARALLAAATLREMGYGGVSAAGFSLSDWRARGLPMVVPRRLSDVQRERYGRHVVLPEIGTAGQLRLLESRVLVVGAGGLGSPALLYLGAAGVGAIGIVDDDVVDASNLQRQIVHDTAKVGQPKTESAALRIRRLNPDVSVTKFDVRLSASNVEEIVSQFDVIIDGSDNFPTRYLLCDASTQLGKPLVHGAIYRFEGQVTTFVPSRAHPRFSAPAGPCYRCLFPGPPPKALAPNCQQAGVLGALCGVVGSLQAVEALKLLTGIGEPLVGRMLTFDALSLRFREMRFASDPSCSGCGQGASFAGYSDTPVTCAAHAAADL